MIFQTFPDNRRDIILIVRCYLLLLFLSLCVPWHAAQVFAAIQPVAPGDVPVFTDDDSQESLLTAARIHRSYLAQLPVDHTAKIYGLSYSRNWLISSLDEFITLIENASGAEQLNRKLIERFEIYQSTGRRSGPGNTMLVTGYFEPVIQGSLQKTPKFRFPIYSPPPSLVSRKSNTGQTEVGRIGKNNAFLPFWTRAEIEGSNVLASSELVYLADPVSAFFLQIQGSGRISLPDGSIRSVRFAGHNGHGYKSIGKLLVDEGKLELHNSSTPNIKQYLAHHPEEQRRVLHYNPRIIFFNWGDDGPPNGSLGLPLTAGRSIALDQSLLSTGVFYWLSSTVPILNDGGEVVAWVPDKRFVLPQDSGAAIEGPGRVDLFMGSGHYAKHAAGVMRQPGKLYLFIKKGFPAVSDIPTSH
ncbi:murein transglycosylase A [Desulfosediminicola ganghwensis]|uniref:murein transglycosylase A n=1 Tax=Desulfosediminicola ganghwensis TaxID=2569540 RepID=UPI0010AC13FF|nr:MltA domain-containing protein [Desulfosediminicola ganghwensis]